MFYLLKQLIEIIIPQKYHLQLRFLWQKLSKKIDPEMLFVEKILTNKRGFVDIGANVGIYTYYFSKKFSAEIQEWWYSKKPASKEAGNVYPDFIN